MYAERMQSVHGTPRPQGGVRDRKVQGGAKHILVHSPVRSCTGDGVGLLNFSVLGDCNLCVVCVC